MAGSSKRYRPVPNKDSFQFLPPGTKIIHVWKVRWRALPHSFEEAALSLLSSEEILRRERYKMPDDRARFTAARGLLRHLGGLYRECDGKNLTIGESAHGKPFFEGAKDTLSFNVSHSGEWIFLAFAAGIPVGIDVQQMTERPNIMKIARAVFHPDEIAALEKEKAAEVKRHLFYTLWARKEAVIKAAGDGLHGAMETFSALPDIVHYGTENLYEIHDLAADDTHRAALAVNDKGCAVQEKSFEEFLFFLT